MDSPPKLRLSWCLIKPDVDLNDEDAIIEPPETGALQRFRVPVLHKKRNSLFLKRSTPMQPSWFSWMFEYVDTEQSLPRILGSSSSAVLLVRTAGRLLAVVFGYGRALLREEALVQDFGLRVVLNTVNPARIKSIDARTFDELTVHTRRGVSRDSTLTAFELDVTRNLLRGITGTSSTEALSGQLSGSAALAMNSAVTLPQLPTLGKTLIETYAAKRYRTHFRFIDDMRAERDPATIAILDDLLLHALQVGELTDMHLAIPEAIDWQEINGVRFSIGQKRHQSTPDPRISIYRSLRDPAKLTIDGLKKHKVQAVSALDENQIKGQWRVYDCIVYETQHAGALYVLSGGGWYQISNRYRKQVETFIRSLPELDIGLPPARPSDDESSYNQRAAAKIGALCLDGKLVATGGPDKVEICDLLTRQGTLIHVKKRGRSSTLSHLFAQGVNSTELLLYDQGFLDATTALVNKLNPTFSSAVPSVLQARDRITVAFVILSRSRRTDTPHGLPFFSLVSLRAAARHLQNAGVRVHIREVKEAPNHSKEES
jgi:uncharacterized protein (TIGR04141 family)